MTDTPPELEIEDEQDGFWAGVSAVWLIPVIALIAALGLAWQNYSSRGPLIEITFTDASAIREKETEVRYRNVTVGVVDKVTFSDDLSQVIVRVRLEPEVADFVDDDASFWVVSPEVTTRGITGLETVLSGVFIEATWDEVPDGTQYFFDGLDQAPIVRPGQEGIVISLRTDAGEGLANGTPILYRGIEVGRLSNARIGRDGLSSVADAFIEAPFDDLISSSTRFWDTSGFTFTIGPSGANVDFQSLAALVAGGITFDTVVSGGESVGNGAVFRLYLDEATARGSIFADAETQAQVQISMVFEDSAAGLVVGSPIELSGITVGEVTSLTGVVDDLTFGDSKVRLLVTAALRPSRFGIGDAVTEQQFLQFLTEQVDQGLRARLTSASLLTGGLKVELAQLADAEAAELDTGAIPFPVLPTGPSNIGDVAATAEGVFQRINQLRIEEVLDSAINLMDSGTRLLNSEDVAALPADVRGLVGDARGIVGSEELQALPGQLSETATSLQEAAADLQELLAAFENQDGVARVLAAVDGVTKTADAITASTEGLPALIEETTTLAGTLSELDMTSLIANADALVTSANTLISSEETAAIPANLNAALGEVETALNDLRADEGIARIVAAVEAVGSAADGLGTTMEQLGPTIDTLPALSEQMTALAGQASELELQALVAEAQAALAGVTALTTSEDAAALPADLRAAIQGFNATLAELNTAETVASATAALESVSAAADQITATAAALEPTLEGLPALSAELTELASTAGDLELQALVGEAEAALAGITALTTSEDTLALPGSLRGAVDELNAAITTFQEADGMERLVGAIDAAARAADQVATATDGLPTLIANVTTFSEGLAELPTEEPVAQADTLLESLNAIVATQDAQELPGALNDALLQLTNALSELREGGTVTNVNAALASASDAAQSIEAAADQLPALMARLNAALAQTQSTVGAYGEDSQVNRELRAALRQVQEAAEALESLARAIERRPDSLLRGR